MTREHIGRQMVAVSDKLFPLFCFSCKYPKQFDTVPSSLHGAGELQFQKGFVNSVPTLDFVDMVQSKATEVFFIVT